MKRAEILETTESILNKAGFQISERCIVRRSCFDLAARRREQLVLIRGIVNIGNISNDEASEFQRISEYFYGTPLIVGDKTHGKSLDDDTVYTRYNINTITPKTLGNVVLTEMLPLVEAGPGGCYVNLDENIIKEKRQELGLSVGKLAELLGVSRGTIYGYERGIVKASVPVAYRLEWVLGAQVAHPIEILGTPPQEMGFLKFAIHRIARNRLLRLVLRKLARLKFKVNLTKMVPFDFIARPPDIKLNIIGGVAGEKELNIEKRTEEITSVSKVLNAQPVFITDKELVSENIALINQEDLSKIRCQEDFMAYI